TLGVFERNHGEPYGISYAPPGVAAGGRARPETPCARPGGQEAHERPGATILLRCAPRPTHGSRAMSKKRARVRARRPAPAAGAGGRRRLTHFNARGEAHMVDVGAKAVTERRALAEGRILMRAETLALILEGGHKKGDVLGVARIAGIQAAKKTAELVPLCHPPPLSAVELRFEPSEHPPSVRCEAEV